MGKGYCYDDIIESNKKVMDKLKEIKQDNKESKNIAIIALSLAFLGISLTSLFKIISMGVIGYLVISVVYGAMCGWLLLKAYKLGGKDKK